MKTVHEVSRLSGVTVRTLHHYDAIGLLKPTELTDAGYRLYDDSALYRLQTILMYRELGFSLSDIRNILDSPAFDLVAALDEHIEMLRMQRAHIDGLIEQAEKMRKGGNAGFSAFDRTAMNKYAEEVKERWGSTAAYAESLEKEKGRSEKENSALGEGMADIFRELASAKERGAASPEAQEAVGKLREYITENFYTCTDEILAGLGEMYAANERFRKNIDGEAGEGTAVFAAEAIRIFCGR